MKKIKNPALYLAFSMLLIASCSAKKVEKVDDKIATDNLVFTQEPEPIKGRVDVYDAMTRAIKYNVDNSSQNLNKSLYNQTVSSSAKEVVKGIVSARMQDNISPLYDSARVLEFATIYAMSVLEEGNYVFLSNYYYSKSAQHLALAAIKAHHEAMFAAKKIKDLDRKIAQEQRVLKLLNAKYDRNGTLNDEDLTHKKALEVAVYKMTEIKKALAFSLIEYSQLTQVNDKDVSIEGRVFYELEDFDKKYNIETFIQSAARNRVELDIAKDSGKNFYFEDIKANSISMYPEMERLKVNGFDVKDPIYAENLEKRTLKIAENLINLAMQYKQEKNPSKKMILKEEIYKNLGVAIFAQNEVAFNIVKLADIDYQNVKDAIKEKKDELKSIGNGSRLSADKKEEILNLNVDLINLEIRLNQISAERAVALRSLFFNAGFQPFTKHLMSSKNAEIVKSLKVAFNQDVVQILSASEAKSKKGQKLVNEWARGEDWLDELMQNPYPQAVKKDAGPNFDLYIGDKFDSYKTMQLGSFFEKSSAYKEWDKLQKQYSEFSSLKPVVEVAYVEDVKMYRLVVRSQNGGFMQLCNQLRTNRVECLLK